MTHYDIHAGNQVFLELFEGNAHPMWVYDNETLRFLAVNEAMMARYGYTRDELLAMTTLDIRPPEDIERFKSHIRHKSDGVDQAGRWRHRTKRGATLHVDITTRGIMFEGRSARLVLAIDVTEQVEALESLKATENLYRGLVEHSMVGLYVVKDGKLAYANPRLAEMFGYAPEQMQDMDILELAAPEQRDAMLAAIRARQSDRAATGRDVFSGRRRDGSEIIIDVHSARIGARGEPIMMGVVLDVTAAKRAEAKAQEHVTHLQRVLDDTLRAISALGEIRDAYTAGHETRVGRLAAALGAELGISSNEQNALRMAGQVHDAGKIGIPAEILSKPSRLNALEYDLMKTHPQLGYDVVKFIDFRQPVAEIVLQHHERIDGSGYPRGLTAETMLPLAKILAIADVVEAMHSHRPYRAGLGIDIALDEIESNTGRLYDAGVSAACVRLFRQRGYRIH